MYKTDVELKDFIKTFVDDRQKSITSFLTKHILFCQGIVLIYFCYIFGSNSKKVPEIRKILTSRVILMKLIRC